MCELGGYGRPRCGKLEMKIGNHQCGRRAGETKNDAGIPGGTGESLCSRAVQVGPSELRRA